VGAKIEEPAAARQLRDDAPRPPRGVGVVRLGRAVEGHGGESDIAQGAAVHQVFHRSESRQGATVIGDEEGDAGGAAGADHLVALRGRARHGLLDVDGLARARRAQRVLAVGAGRRRDVDGIHVGIADQGVRIVMPFGDAVPPRVIGRLRAVAAHDGDQAGAVRLLERRAALDLGDVPAADDAPADVFEHGALPVPTRRRGLLIAGGCDEYSEAGKAVNSRVACHDNGSTARRSRNQKRCHEAHEEFYHEAHEEHEERRDHEGTTTEKKIETPSR
jgi:hypothetical protein